MEVFIGTIQPFAFNFAPQGWALCEGQILSLNQYQALFALIGTTYGGNGSQNFGLPNLQGRLPIGQGNGVNLRHSQNPHSGCITHSVLHAG